MKMRKRRVPHRDIYYPLEFFENNKRMQDDIIQRLENSRIFSRIESYGEKITSRSEEAFMAYTDSSDKFKKLKETFINRTD